ncbi:MAG: hypothetical protein AAGB48_12955 [Planctomycetota bacterium]
MKLMLLLIACLLTGCTYNASPMHLHMRTSEFRNAAGASFCLGMSPTEAAEAANTAALSYDIVPTDSRAERPGVAMVEVELWKAGVRLWGACCPGFLRLRFEDDRLVSAELLHPLPDEPTILAEAQPVMLGACESADEEAGG